MTQKVVLKMHPGIWRTKLQKTSSMGEEKERKMKNIWEMLYFLGVIVFIVLHFLASCLTIPTHNIVDNTDSKINPLFKIYSMISNHVQEICQPVFSKILKKLN